MATKSKKETTRRLSLETHAVPTAVVARNEHVRVEKGRKGRSKMGKRNSWGTKQVEEVVHLFRSSLVYVQNLKDRREIR